jgi:hypothetical protein
VKPNWTPIKVRGKRHRTLIEKAAEPKRRNATLRKTWSSKQASDSKDDGSKPLPRKQRRETMHITLLESLPAEILQMIFEYSLNLDFPFTCTRTIAALSGSHHLHTCLTTGLLSPILHACSPFDVLQARLNDAHRILNSRFMTWSVFSRWLCTQAQDEAHIHEQSADALSKVWMSLEPARTLLPPTKLLRAPFTEDKTSFLTILAAPAYQVLAHDKGLHAEVAREGLEHAVRVGDVSMLSLLFRLGMPSDTDLLRVAVIGRNMSPDMFDLIVSPSGPSGDGLHGRTANDAIDFLDEEVWQQMDHGAPIWLKRALKEAQIRKERRQLEYHEHVMPDV